ncbi:MAG: hypothetical protein OEY96_12215, partial [Gammaproteobacteria bacterium]|nr:hypothetical protein [Gammaproteobacteria bacterium]
MDKIITALRLIFCTYYITVGFLVLLIVMGFIDKPELNLNPQSTALLEAFHQSGFIFPLLGMAYSSSGIMILFRRTRPLGVVILAPLVLAIMLNHIILDGNPIWGISHAAL